jgi:hypothetical protein
MKKPNFLVIRIDDLRYDEFGAPFELTSLSASSARRQRSS